MILEKDFRDFIDLLNNHDVDFMVVGGYALAFHGEPRMTGDMDIWINRTKKNAVKLVAVINDFGMSSLGLTQKDFLEKGIINQIGYPPLRIDIMNEIDGVAYNEAVKDKQFFKVHGFSIPFIGLTDFIKNKEASGRKKDLQDAQKLKQKALPKKLKRNNNKGKKNR